MLCMHEVYGDMFIVWSPQSHLLCLKVNILCIAGKYLAANMEGGWDSMFYRDFIKVMLPEMGESVSSNIVMIK